MYLYGFQGVSLLLAWLPFWLNEIWLLVNGIEEHFKIAKPSPKAYLIFFTIIMPKYLYILMFRALVFRPKHLLDMLTDILSTESKFQDYGTKTKFQNLTKNLLLLPIILLFVSRLGLRLLWFIRIFNLNSDALKNPSLELYKGFGMKWIFGLNSLHSNKLAGLSIYILGVWLYVTPRLIWVWFNVLLAGVIPVTFLIVIAELEFAAGAIDLKDQHSCLNAKSLFDMCRLFDNMKIMSLSVNAVWGNIILVWLIIVSTRYAINMNIFN